MSSIFLANFAGAFLPSVLCVGLVFVVFYKRVKSLNWKKTTVIIIGSWFVLGLISSIISFSAVSALFSGFGIIVVPIIISTCFVLLLTRSAKSQNDFLFLVEKVSFESR